MHNGKKDVIEEIIYEDGTTYRGEINDKGQKDGRGIYYSLDGSNYEGQWQEDKKYGFGKYINVNGEKYIGYWKDDIKEGRGTLVYVDKSIFIGDLQNNKRHGEGILFKEEGIEIGCWEEDELIVGEALNPEGNHNRFKDIILKHSIEELIVFYDTKYQSLVLDTSNKEIRNKLFEAKIEDVSDYINITIGIYSIIKKLKLETIGDILNKDKDEYLKTSLCNVRVIKQISNILAKLGLVENWIGNIDEVKMKIKYYRNMAEEARINLLKNPCGECKSEEVSFFCHERNKEICQGCCIKMQLDINIDREKEKDIIKQDGNYHDSCVDCERAIQKSFVEKYDEKQEEVLVRQSEAYSIKSRIIREYFKKNSNISWYELTFNKDLSREQYYVIASSYEKCIDKYMKIKEVLQVNEYELYFNLGKNFIQKGRVQEALKYFTKAYKINPNQKISSALGNAYERLEDYDKALRWYKMSIGSDPYVYILIAKTYENLGKYENAAKYYIKAIESDEEYLYISRDLARLYKTLALKHSNKKLYLEKAIEYFKKSTEWSRREGEWEKNNYLLDCSELAFCYINLNEYEEVVKYASIALNKYPHETRDQFKDKFDKIKFFIVDSDDDSEEEALWKDSLSENEIDMATILHGILAKSYLELDELQKAYNHITNALNLKSSNEIKLLYQEILNKYNEKVKTDNITNLFRLRENNIPNNLEKRIIEKFSYCIETQRDFSF